MPGHLAPLPKKDQKTRFGVWFLFNSKTCVVNRSLFLKEILILVLQKKAVVVADEEEEFEFVLDTTGIRFAVGEKVLLKVTAFETHFKRYCNHCFVAVIDVLFA